MAVPKMGFGACESTFREVETRLGVASVFFFVFLFCNPGPLARGRFLNLFLLLARKYQLRYNLIKKKIKNLFPSLSLFLFLFFSSKVGRADGRADRPVMLAATSPRTNNNVGN